MIKVFEALLALSLIEQIVSKDKEIRITENSGVRLSLGRTLRVLKELKDDYEKEHINLVKQLGAKSEDGKSITVKPENHEKYLEQVQKMVELELDVTIPMFTDNDINVNALDLDFISELQRVRLLN